MADKSKTPPVQATPPTTPQPTQQQPPPAPAKKEATTKKVPSIKDVEKKAPAKKETVKKKTAEKKPSQNETLKEIADILKGIQENLSEEKKVKKAPAKKAAGGEKDVPLEESLVSVFGHAGFRTSFKDALTPVFKEFLQDTEAIENMKKLLVDSISESTKMNADENPGYSVSKDDKAEKEPEKKEDKEEASKEIKDSIVNTQAAIENMVPDSSGKFDSETLLNSIDSAGSTLDTLSNNILDNLNSSTGDKTLNELNEKIKEQYAEYKEANKDRKENIEKLNQSINGILDSSIDESKTNKNKLIEGLLDNLNKNVTLGGTNLKEAIINVNDIIKNSIKDYSDKNGVANDKELNQLNEIAKATAKSSQANKKQVEQSETQSNKLIAKVVSNKKTENKVSPVKALSTAPEKQLDNKKDNKKEKQVEKEPKKSALKSSIDSVSKIIQSAKPDKSKKTEEGKKPDKSKTPEKSDKPISINAENVNINSKNTSSKSEEKKEEQPKEKKPGIIKKIIKSKISSIKNKTVTKILSKFKNKKDDDGIKAKQNNKLIADKKGPSKAGMSSLMGGGKSIAKLESAIKNVGKGVKASGKLLSGSGKALAKGGGTIGKLLKSGSSSAGSSISKISSIIGKSASKIPKIGKFIGPGISAAGKSLGSSISKAGNIAGNTIAKGSKAAGKSLDKYGKKASKMGGFLTKNAKSLAKDMTKKQTPDIKKNNAKGNDGIKKHLSNIVLLLKEMLSVDKKAASDARKKAILKTQFGSMKAKPSSKKAGFNLGGMTKSLGKMLKSLPGSLTKGLMDAKKKSILKIIGIIVALGLAIWVFLKNPELLAKIGKWIKGFFISLWNILKGVLKKASNTAIIIGAILLAIVLWMFLPIHLPVMLLLAAIFAVVGLIIKYWDDYKPIIIGLLITFALFYFAIGMVHVFGPWLIIVAAVVMLFALIWQFKDKIWAAVKAIGNFIWTVISWVLFWPVKLLMKFFPGLGQKMKDAIFGFLKKIPFIGRFFGGNKVNEEAEAETKARNKKYGIGEDSNKSSGMPSMGGGGGMPSMGGGGGMPSMSGGGGMPSMGGGGGGMKPSGNSPIVNNSSSSSSSNYSSSVNNSGNTTVISKHEMSSGRSFKVPKTDKLIYLSAKTLKRSILTSGILVSKIIKRETLNQTDDLAYEIQNSSSSFGSIFSFGFGIFGRLFKRKRDPKKGVGHPLKRTLLSISNNIINRVDRFSENLNKIYNLMNKKFENPFDNKIIKNKKLSSDFKNQPILNKLPKIEETKTKKQVLTPPKKVGFFGKIANFAGSLVPSFIKNKVSGVKNMLTSLIPDSIKNKISGVKNMLTSIPGKIGEKISGVKNVVSSLIPDSIKNKISGVKNMLTSIPGRIGNALTSIPGRIGNALTSIPGKFIGFAGSLVPSFIKNKVSGVKNMLTSFIPDSIKNKISGFKNALTSFIPDSIKDKISGFKNTLTSFIPDSIKDKISGFKNIVSSMIPDSIKDKISGVKNMLTSIPGRIGNALTSIPGKLGEKINGVKNMLTSFIPDSIKNKISGFKNALTSIPGRIGNALTSIPGKIGEKISGFKNIVSSMIPDSIKNKISGFKNALTSFIPDSIKDKISGVKNMLTSIPGKIGEKISGVKNIVSSMIPDSIKEKVSGFKNKLTSLIPDFLKGNKSENKKESGGFFSSMFGKVKSFFGSKNEEHAKSGKKSESFFSSLIPKSIKEKVSGFKNKLTSLIPASIKEKVSGFKNKLTSLIPESIEKISGFIPESIKEKFNEFKNKPILGKIQSIVKTGIKVAGVIAAPGVAIPALIASKVKDELSNSIKTNNSIADNVNKKVSVKTNEGDSTIKVKKLVLSEDSKIKPSISNVKAMMNESMESIKNVSTIELNTNNEPKSLANEIKNVENINKEKPLEKTMNSNIESIEKLIEHKSKINEIESNSLMPINRDYQKNSSLSLNKNESFKDMNNIIEALPNAVHLGIASYFDNKEIKVNDKKIDSLSFESDANLNL